MPTSLVSKKCGPCAHGVPPYTLAQVEPFLKELPDWELVREPPMRLQREVIFKNFKEAMVFVNRVADLAEGEGHHPNLFIRWNRVTVELYTHKIGGLHENDFIVAAKIGRLL